MGTQGEDGRLEPSRGARKEPALPAPGPRTSSPQNRGRGHLCPSPVRGVALQQRRRRSRSGVPAACLCRCAARGLRAARLPRAVAHAAAQGNTAHGAALPLTTSPCTAPRVPRVLLISGFAERVPGAFHVFRPPASHRVYENLSGLVLAW